MLGFGQGYYEFRLLWECCIWLSVAFGGRSQACREFVCVSRCTGKDSFTSRAALHLSATAGLRVGGFQEHPHVIWGVILSIFIIIVQGETMRSRAAIIRVKGNEVDYLLTDLALRFTIPF